MNYDDEMLQEINDNANLIEYVQNTGIELKAQGEDYFTSCPLHINDTPSLSFTPSKNSFYFTINMYIYVVYILIFLPDIVLNVACFLLIKNQQLHYRRKNYISYLINYICRSGIRLLLHIKNIHIILRNN